MVREGELPRIDNPHWPQVRLPASPGSAGKNRIVWKMAPVARVFPPRGNRMGHRPASRAGGISSGLLLADGFGPPLCTARRGAMGRISLTQFSMLHQTHRFSHFATRTTSGTLKSSKSQPPLSYGNRDRPSGALREKPSGPKDAASICGNRHGRVSRWHFAVTPCREMRWCSTMPPSYCFAA